MDDYKINYRRLKRFARKLIHINVALSDEVSKIGEKISRIETEKMHLLKELLTVNPTLRRQLLNNTKLFGGERSKEGVKVGRSDVKSRQKRNKKSKNSDMSTLEYLPTKYKKHQKAPTKAISPFLQSSIDKGGTVHKASLVPLDPQGRPVFPVKLEKGSLIVYSIGEISAQPAFHSLHCIYPIGFCSTRLYQSINPTGLSSIETPSIDECLYTCKVSEAAGKPKFEIIAEDCTGITFVGSSPDDCCNKLRHTMSQFWEDQAGPIDGGWFFGLSHPNIKNFIQCMPGAKKCSNYQWVKYEIVKEDVAGKSVDGVDGGMVGVCAGISNVADGGFMHGVVDGEENVDSGGMGVFVDDGVEGGFGESAVVGSEDVEVYEGACGGESRQLDEHYGKEMQFY